MAAQTMKVSRTALLCGLIALGFVACRPTGAGSDPESSGANGGSRTGTARELTTKSGIQMIAIPGGEFMMGSDRGNPDEAPAHRVRISPFLMDKYEVVHEMFAQAQLPNPSHWQDDPRKPVERVRWQDARQYCNERSLLEGLEPCYDELTGQCNFQATGYRLPTEAEWEYACRAGAVGDYDFGAAAKLRQHGWFDENGSQRTHVVGQKRPNGWGLHDMYGNVSEWCEDVYSPNYYKESPELDPRGPADPGNDVLRVMRGGSWKASAGMCRAPFRQGQRTGNTDACFYTDYCGFRCVRRADP